ncbi:MAG: ribonucleotide-diphosphate reductase subunit beta, partial [bacterium]
MQADVEQWKSRDALSANERRLILWNLGFFATAESLTANNIVMAVYRHIANPECRQYMLRQAFEEAVHTDTFIYCCDSLGLDPNDIYKMYETIPSIKEKDDFVVDLTKQILDPTFAVTTIDDVQQLVRNIVGFYVIMEGIFFYAGFAMMLALKRQNKMLGIGEQFEYIMRDESLHLAFGCDIINTLKQEHPAIWTQAFQDELVELIKKAVYLEARYAKDACPQGMLGINAEQFVQYVQHIADRRLVRIGLSEVYLQENPFPWMAQSTDLQKEKNFFETRVTEYQSAGALDMDDF